MFTFSPVKKKKLQQTNAKRKPFLFFETTDAAFDLGISGQISSCLHVLNFLDLPVWRQQLGMTTFERYEWFKKNQSAQLLLKKRLFSLHPHPFQFTNIQGLKLIIIILGVFLLLIGIICHGWRSLGESVLPSDTLLPWEGAYGWRVTYLICRVFLFLCFGIRKQPVLC